MLLVLLALVLGYLGYRLTHHFEQEWQWDTILRYLFRYDEKKSQWVPNMLVEGLLTTIRISIWATFMATIIGLVMGLFRSSRSRFKRMVGRTFVEIVRNMPPLVLIFIFFYFVSDQIMPLLGVDDFIRSRSEKTQDILAVFIAPPARFSAFISAAVTMAIYEGAYITEIIRSGIQSIEKGQWEASHALGLSWWQQMRHVVLPQAFQRTIPPMAGQFISTIKDSSIISVISIQELTFQGSQLMAATYLTFEVWTTVALLYLILTLTCSLAARWLEAHMRRVG